MLFCKYLALVCIVPSVSLAKNELSNAQASIFQVLSKRITLRLEAEQASITGMNSELVYVARNKTFGSICRGRGQWVFEKETVFNVDSNSIEAAANWPNLELCQYTPIGYSLSGKVKTRDGDEIEVDFQLLNSDEWVIWPEGEQPKDGPHFQEDLARCWNTEMDELTCELKLDSPVRQLWRNRYNIGYFSSHFLQLATKGFKLKIITK